MMEQMDLFSDIVTEYQVYEQLLPALQDALAKSNAGADNLAIDKYLQYSSVSYLKYDLFDQDKSLSKQLVFRVCLRNGKHYFGVSNEILRAISPGMLPPVSDAKPVSEFTNFDFDPTPSGIARCADFLVAVLNEVTYGLQKRFDCCSRYSQCSAEGRCIHPNTAMATSCGYRKVLRDGKNYYA